MLDAYWTPVLILLLLIGLLAFRPSGLLGREVASGSEDVPPPAPPTVATRSLPGSRWLLGSLLLLGLLYPWIADLTGSARLYDAAGAPLLVTLAVGLSVVVGFTGLLDLGYAAFFALGGYMAALLTASGSRIAPTLPALARLPGWRSRWPAWWRPGSASASVCRASAPAASTWRSSPWPSASWSPV